MAREDKTPFEEIEKKLSLSPEIMASALNMKNKNIYQTYRKLSKMYLFKILALGIYVARSSLTIDEIVKSIEHTRDIKGIK